MVGTIKQQLQAQAPVQRLTRTQRVAGQQEYARNVAVAQELQALKNQADTLMQSSTPENYSEKYSQLDERIKQYYLSPTEYFALPEVQKYKQEKKKYDEALQDQKDYEIAKKYSKYAKMSKVSHFYMIVSFKEKATPRQLKYFNQIVAKDKALEEYYSPANVKARAEVKLTPLNQSELIAVGQASQLLVKNVGESEASYNYRLAQLGKATAIAQPVATQQKLNTIKWQSENPNEVLVYDKSGNVAGVESARFSQSLSIEQYNKKIEDYNASIKTPKQLRNEAKPYLEDFGKKAENFREVTQPTKLNIFDYGKALWLSSPFGKSMKFNEEITKELTEERRQYGGIIVPYKESLEAIKEEKSLNVKAEEKAKLFEELTGIVEKAPEELKYDIQKQGMNILVSQTGLRTQEQKIGQLKYDNALTGEIDLKNIESVGSQIVITDNDFGRKISEFTLKLEQTNAEIPTITKTVESPIYRSETGIYNFETGRYETPTKITTTYKSKPFTLRKAFLYSEIISTKAVEFYGTTKLIGFGISKIGSGLKYGYEAIGGGLKVADFSIKGSKITATVLPTVLSKTGKIAVATAKYSAGAGLVGLYGYQKLGQYQTYKQTSKSGKELFLLETTGEVLGMGLAIGEEVYNRQQVKNLNKRLEQENALLQQKKEALQNIQRYGQYSEKAELSYQTKGTGKEVKLNELQLKSLAKDYAQVKGISEKEAIKLLKEETFYKQTLKVKGSTVPSIEAQLKTSRTGVSSAGKQYYETSRYGFSDVYKTDSGLREIGFEFNLKGNKVTNLQLKTVVSKDNIAVASIFEKTRTTKGQGLAFRLKELDVIKATKFKTKIDGNKVISLIDTESRVLSKYPYGKAKFDLQESVKLGLSKQNLKNIEQSWMTAGEVSRTGTYKTLRMESPLFKGGESLKVAVNKDYEFYQTGTGKRNLPMKNIVGKLDEAGYFKELIKYKKPSTQLINLETTQTTAIIPSESSLSKTLIKETLNKEISTQTMAYAPTTSTTFSIKTRTALKQLVSAQLLSDTTLRLASGMGVASRTITKTKNAQILKTDLQNKQLNSQLNKLDIGMAQKSESATKQKTRTKLSSMQKLITNIPFAPYQPVTPTKPKIIEPPITPFVPFAFGFELPSGKQKIKEKLKKKNIESFALFPDFSARIIGLEPKEYNEKQLEKEAMSIQTGFEIRRGGIVRKGRGRPKKAESMLMKKMKVPKDMDYLKNTVKKALKVKW